MSNVTVTIPSLTLPTDLFPTEVTTPPEVTTTPPVVIPTTAPPTTTEPPPPTTTTTQPPTTTTTVPETTTTPSTTIVTSETSTITTDPTQPPSTTVIVETSTIAPTEVTTTTSSSATRSPTPSALAAGGDGDSGSGLGTGGTIAIAVVIPIVVIAALLFLGFWLWRKRKARKNAEEMRKNEMAEYGFNPNNDPSLAPAGASYHEDQSVMTEENSGYRGWGATSAHKPGTTLGSRGPGMSDGGSQPGGYYPSPNAYSDAYSADPLVGHPEGHDGVGALGGAAAGAAAAGGLARGRSQGGGGLRRGPSNASSSYSGRAHSEASSDAPSMPGPYYEQEVPYNDYGQTNQGPYGDSYGDQGPVVRDNPARRNTRIERAPNFPSGQGGISQNF